MAEQNTIPRPVQVFLDTKQFITVPERHSGHSNRDFFNGNNHGFSHHKSAMREKILVVSETLRRQNQAAGFVIVQMHNDALAKSYRPLRVLFSRSNSFGLVGGGSLGEMFFQCTPDALQRLDYRIEERAEIEPRMTTDRNSGKLAPRPSAYRCELSGIEDIRLPAGYDRISFSAREAYEWFRRPNTFGAYIVELFQLDSTLNPVVADRMIEGFRQRLDNLGGIVALPLFPSDSKHLIRGHLTMAIHLISRRYQSFIFFPSDSRVSAYKALLREMPRLDSQDVSIERHQEFLQLMGNEPLIRRINLPPSLEATPIEEASQVPKIDKLPDPPQNGTPIVGIVDGGVADIPAISSWRSGGTEFVAPADRDNAHGTFIAGLVAGAQTLNPRIAATLEPVGCRYFDIPLWPKKGLESKYYVSWIEFFDQLEEEIRRAKFDADVRVFNLSFGVRSRDREYSDFAQLLDYIAVEHDVLFVVSAGNLCPLNVRPPWPPDGDSALRLLALRPAVDEHVKPPAEHLLGLTIGALNTPGIPRYGTDLPASYTRRGPGVAGALKPDLTHYGGATSSAGGDSGLFSFASDNDVVNKSGTSFSTPLVASTLATIDYRLEGSVPREMLIALLVHRARRGEAMQHKALRHVAREFVGYGMPPPADECLSDDPHSITLVFSESLVSGKELQFIFAWPKSLVNSEGKCRGRVDLTLAFTPPIDARFDAECIRKQLEVSLQQIEIDPVTGDENPKSHLKHFDSVGPTQSVYATERHLLRTGLKWAPIKRYRLTMQRGRGTSSNWRLLLRSYSRAGDFIPNIGVPFCIVMTISDLEKTAPVYDEVRNEINRRGLRLEDITVAHRLRPRN